MSSPRRVLVVYGTRPEAIKLCPVVLGMQGSTTVIPIVAVTAQHRAMLDQVNEVFGITPDHDLDIIQHGQTLTDITIRGLRGLEDVIAEERPDAVLVQGDTTTTFAGALAAFYAKVPVFHLEAGLRTFHRYSPFPEELNRRLTTQLTSLHLAATPLSRDNLAAEGVADESIVVTGNTVIDALLATVGKRVPYDDERLEILDRDRRRVLLVTAHRRESWGAPLEEVGAALADLARSRPDLLVVIPLHRNPVVRNAVVPAVAGLENVVVTEPQSYGPFCRLMARADVILTDSGGVQEEGPSLGKPVLVMRDTTERPEAVHAGTARLVGTSRGEIVRWVGRLLDDNDAYAAMANAVNPYGDGRATERVIAAVDHYFGLGQRPAEFSPDEMNALTSAAER